MTGAALPPALDSHTLLVAAVVVHDEAAGRVFLLQRGPGRSSHHCTGTCRQEMAAAARELKEETGLTVDPASLKIAGIIHGAWGVEAPNGFLTVIFVARIWDGEPCKHAKVAWFPADEVPLELVPDRREALLGYLRSPDEPVATADGF